MPFPTRRPLPTVLAACAFLFAPVVLAGPPAPDQAPADQPSPVSPVLGPRIAIDPPAFDFGKVLAEKSVSREFSIRSFGTEDLVIANVSTSCGCTVADNLAQKVVKPGGNQPLRVTLTAPAHAGAITKSVMVRSNDPVHPLLEIKLKATVVADTP